MKSNKMLRMMIVVAQEHDGESSVQSGGPYRFLAVFKDDAGTVVVEDYRDEQEREATAPSDAHYYDWNVGREIYMPKESQHGQ